ncbi:MAG: TonB-dependent receptor [Flammeovirgaceae bacterium]|nr:MAG: TonB-dependent receptor [Flammeovirgaceae bacterium]
MSLRLTIVFLSITVSINPVSAQQTTFKGTVLDAETRQPLAYASVLVTGTDNGTTTDEAGNFILAFTGEAKNTILKISYVGYVTELLPISSKQTRYTIMLKPEATTLPEVAVVSATLKEVSKADSPIPVEIYTPALFRKNPTPSIFESLGMINGVQPQINCNVCNTGDIHINGMEGPYTMVLIDGMPIVSSLSTVYGLSGIPNNMVKRIEIVKGPASTLYGSEAVAGLINIITKEPSLSPRFNVDVQATSLAEFNTDISSAWKARKSNGLLGMNYFLFNNPLDINHDNFTDVTQQNRFSVFNKWQFHRAHNRQATLAARYVYEDRWGGELQWTRADRGSNQVYGESIFTNRAELIGAYQLASQKLFVDYSYNYHHQDSYYGITKYLAHQHVAFAQLRYTKSIGRHDLLIGIPIRFTRYDDSTPATPLPQNTWLPGFFVQNEFRASEKITWLWGMRYDYHNVHGSIYSPRISLKYAPAQYHTFRLTAGNGFRVVNLFTEDHAALTGSREVVIKNKLNPEQSWNVNLNYATTIRLTTGYINLDASVFYTHFTNKIVGDFLTNSDQIIYDNLNGYAVSKGITLNADAAFTSGFKFMAGATLMDVYQKQRDSLDVMQTTPQLFAPVFSGTYSLSYTLDRYRITIDLSGRVTGPMHLPVVPNDFRPESSPWFTLMNIQLTKSFTNGIELYGGIKNLFNFIPDNPIYNWQQPFSPEFDTSYNYAPVQGIKAFFGIRYTFQ